MMPIESMRKFWSAGCSPFQFVDCHIWNHSPPTVIKPPPNNIICMSHPHVDNWQATTTPRCTTIARSQQRNATVRTIAMRDSQTMIVRYEAVISRRSVMARHLVFGEPSVVSMASTCSTNARLVL